jgi:hypothetical protein
MIIIIALKSFLVLNNSMTKSMIKFFHDRFDINVTTSKNLQVACKSSDEYEMIFTKSNLIYWSRSWLFDAFQLMSIEIYLYSTILRARSFLNRNCLVYWSYSCRARHELVENSFIEFLSEISLIIFDLVCERSKHDHVCRTDSTD